ncbi:hypothetical protein ACEWY4_020431 [Coilia grayii]|uniref:Peptidase S1 domain-containing protein n=1 Tax=Coilia grayii TaxID=363190 RepID=A0ABD1JCN7_9TELE
MPRGLPICGLTETQIFSSGRILGEKRAKPGEIPWQLLIKHPRGGASLINNRWAVTTASGVDGNKSLKLYGGMVDVMDQKAVVMETEKIIIHPDYEKGISEDRRTSFNNDIALLKMSFRVELGPNLIPICLPEKSEGAALEGKMGTVSGYGMTDKVSIARMLQYADIMEYETEKCPPTNGEGNRLIFTDNMFCAGLEGSSDSCWGDSGGPLFVPKSGMGNPGDPYRLKGIVSWGPNCRDYSYKMYYTKVQNYLAWIRETIDQEEQEGSI